MSLDSHGEIMFLCSWEIPVTYLFLSSQGHAADGRPGEVAVAQQKDTEWGGAQAWLHMTQAELSLDNNA